MANEQKFGGSFAPPLSDEILKKYKAEIDKVDPKSQLGDALHQVYDCCAHWWSLPDSKGKAEPHPVFSAIGVTKLDPDIQEKLFDSIPWMTELDAMGVVFEGINPLENKSLRNLAHHLLWHAKELCLDREPITADKLPKQK